MLAGKKLTDFTSLFSPHYLKKWRYNSELLQRWMNEIDKTNLTDQTKYRLNEITKTENYVNSEINQRKSCIKKLLLLIT